MERSNKTIRKSTKSNGSGKDIDNQANGNRKKTEQQQFIGAATSQTISGIAKDMEQITKGLQENHEEMLITLNKITSDINSITENIDDIRENYL